MQIRAVDLTLYSILSHSWVVSASVHDYHSSPWPARMWEITVKEKRASKEEMAGWHHWCNGRELGQTSGDGEGQGGLACCSPWGCKESDTTGRLNNKVAGSSRPTPPTPHQSFSRELQWWLSSFGYLLIKLLRSSFCYCLLCAELLLELKGRSDWQSNTRPY